MSNFFRFYKCNRIEYYSTKKSLELYLQGCLLFCQGYIKLYFNEPITLDKYTIIGGRLFQIPVMNSPFIMLMNQMINFTEGDGIFTTDDIYDKPYGKRNIEFGGNYLAEEQNMDLQKVNLIMSGINDDYNNYLGK